MDGICRARSFAKTIYPFVSAIVVDTEKEKERGRQIDHCDVYI